MAVTVAVKVTPSLDRAKPQDIYILKAVLDFEDYRRAAAELAIPIATVRTRVHRALKRTGFASLAVAARHLGRIEGRRGH